MNRKKLTFAIRQIFVLSLLFLNTFFLNSSNAYGQEGEDGTSAEEAPAEEAAGPDAALVEQGKVLFEENCATCHKFSSKATGPALAGVTDQQSADWLKAWIKNSQKMIAAGDKHANDLWDEYKPTQMTAFEWMTDEQLDAVVAYLAVGKDASAGPETAGTDGEVVAGEGGQGGNDTLLLSVVLVVLVLIIIVLILLSAFLHKHLKTKEDLTSEDAEVVNQKHDIIKVLKHPTFIGLAATIIVLCGLMFFIKDVVYGIGVQTGYQPTQPINFSHVIHAGENEIDCNYCHTGVRKGKHANIPSPSICMNCHVNIKTESEEIQKIYKAVDYDPETKKFGTNTSPIKWVRIHNLPDHVYFNHSQHVVVGGLECEECHGEIKEMDKVYQYSTLTMGWCIDCHRNKEVNAEGNAYYDKLLNDHEEAGNKEGMTVEDIGGTECARCHY